MELKEFIKRLDLDYFGAGKHKISFDKLIEMYQSDSVLILDVRSSKENKFVTFPFLEKIPLDTLPDHISNLPKNKTIALFCSSQTRAVIAYTYLLTEGFDAKIITENINDFANHFKPGYVKKNLK